MLARLQRNLTRSRYPPKPVIPRPGSQYPAQDVIPRPGSRYPVQDVISRTGSRYPALFVFTPKPTYLCGLPHALCAMPYLSALALAAADALCVITVDKQNQNSYYANASIGIYLIIKIIKKPAYLSM